MRLLGAALICIAVLNGVDAFWFNGLYFTLAGRTMSQIAGLSIVMTRSKLAFVAVAVAIAFASPAFAKTIRHSNNPRAAAPPQTGNPYYAPYANQVQSSGNFIIP
jgi:hypothetical protein